MAKRETQEAFVNIILHIGLEKTGTSTIQGFLKKSRASLLENNILFPLAPGKANQTLLAAACMERDVNVRAHALRRHGPGFEERMKVGMRSEVEAVQPANLLLSNEHCSSRLRSVEEVMRLRDLLAEFGDVTKVIVYLRRQDDFLLSTYSTSIKSGLTRPFAIPGDRKMRARYNYRQMLELWEKAFARSAIQPRRFQPSAWRDGDLLNDFCDAIGVDIPDRDIQSRNLSLSAEGLELLRRLNIEAKGVRNGRVVRAVGALTEGGKLAMSSEQRREFMAHFEKSNSWVARNYFDRQDLFEPVRDDLPENGLPDMTPERFGELSAAVKAAAEDRNNTDGSEFEAED